MSSKERAERHQLNREILELDHPGFVPGRQGSTLERLTEVTQSLFAQPDESVDVPQPAGGELPDEATRAVLEGVRVTEQRMRVVGAIAELNESGLLSRYVDTRGAVPASRAQSTVGAHSPKTTSRLQRRR